LIDREATYELSLVDHLMGKKSDSLLMLAVHDKITVFPVNGDVFVFKNFWEELVL
jgi:hypothetical protein